MSYNTEFRGAACLIACVPTCMLLTVISSPVGGFSAIKVHRKPGSGVLG